MEKLLLKKKPAPSAELQHAHANVVAVTAREALPEIDALNQSVRQAIETREYAVAFQALQRMKTHASQLQHAIHAAAKTLHVNVYAPIAGVDMDEEDDE